MSQLERIARDVLESLHEGCQVIDAEFRYAYVNGSAATQARTTPEALLGKRMMDVFPGIETTQMFATLTACMHDRTHRRMENEFTYPDGQKGWFELRFVPLSEGVCILSLDITVAKHAAQVLARNEDELRQAQKMEAVGRLAGGVAHDFNNVLSVILSYSEMLLADLKQDDPLHGEIGEIRRAAVRASELTQQLLAFSRRQVLQPRVVDLNIIVGDMQKLLARLLGADIELVVLPSRGLGRTRVDPSQVEQVIMNLAVNARDAMPRGGQLTIQTNNVDLDADYARAHPDVTPGAYVMLAVTDTGVGMNKETQARIFEPFFTTKEQGKGTGLGLSTVFGIVKQSGGHIWVYTEPGNGTAFKLYFPRTDAPLERVSSNPPEVHPAGVATILLVEDDDQVRAVARGILRRAGYVILEAANAGEAILASEQHTSPIHLLLTDVIMPRLNGPALAERLHKTRPDLRWCNFVCV
jgi:two-component system cell cycle sensor histidine kinase/response regulator CckA